MPVISAVMALYNTPYEYLKVTLDSVLSQSCNDFELIIIDDASTIDYADFFKNYNDLRINYVKLEKNSGPGHARNVGIKMAQGEFVAIVDSDDVYFPNRFEKQLEFFVQNPDVSLISGAFKQSNNGKIPEVIEENDDIKVAMLFNSQLANPLIMFRREVFVLNNLFYSENINFAEDYQLWIDAMFKGIKVANLKDVLMTYTRRKGQLSKEKSDKQADILKQIYKKIFSKLGIEPTDKELEMHYAVAMDKFGTISSESVENWFNKIINYNEKMGIFNNSKLVNAKLLSLEKFKNNNDKLFRIKLGNYNLYLTKKMRIKTEKRK